MSGAADIDAPGLVGYTFDTPDGLYVPAIMSLEPGQGNASRFLDALPTDRRVVFPNVMNPQLEAMLTRRGFTPGTEWAEEYGEHVECWERLPADSQGAA